MGLETETEAGSWKQKGLTLIGAGLGMLVVAGLGLYSVIVTMSTPFHTEPQSVPSVTNAAVSERWADAVAEGRQLVRDSVVNQNLPGASVAIGVDGEIVWAEGFGWANLENRTPVTPSTRFRIGTASIALTSAAVGVLLEEKRLDLDAEIQTYVPELPKKEQPVTLRQLMGHTAGVRTDGGDEGPLFGQHCTRPVEGLQPFADRALLSEPGAEYRFSSYGWIVVSAAVETAAGEPFDAFMRERVFGPLGMRDTLADSATEQIPDRATPYFPRFSASSRSVRIISRYCALNASAGSRAQNTSAVHSCTARLANSLCLSCTPTSAFRRPMRMPGRNGFHHSRKLPE